MSTQAAPNPSAELATKSERSQIRHYVAAGTRDLVFIRDGVWAYDMGSAPPCELAYTGGIFDKREGGKDLISENFPVYEWKYILEGEWHLIPEDGRKIVAKPGDMVYLPRGCKFHSLSVPFKAFFVTSRGNRAPAENDQHWQ